MFLFLRLLLAHLIGDFPLQAGWVYRSKLHSAGGRILHGLIIGITTVIFAFPFLFRKITWVLIAVFIILHILIDWLKIKIDDKKKIPVFWTFLGDQILHTAVLSSVFLFEFSKAAPKIQHPLFVWYNNDKLITFFIGYLLATFAGTYFLDALKKSYFQRFSEMTESKSVNYGLIERGLIMTVFCFFSFPFYPLVLILFLLDIIIRKKKSAFDFLLNFVYAASSGLIMKAILA